MVFELQLYVFERLVVTVGLNNINLLVDDGELEGVQVQNLAPSTTTPAIKAFIRIIYILLSNYALINALSSNNIVMTNNNSSYWNQIIIFGAGSVSTLLSLFLYQRFTRRLRPRLRKWQIGTTQPIPYNSARGWKAFNPEELKKTGGIYGLMISTVIPRPIALVSSLDEKGVINCAPFSYFNMVSHDPPLVVIGCCINGRTKMKKDTLNNIEGTGCLLTFARSTPLLYNTSFRTICCEHNKQLVCGLC